MKSHRCESIGTDQLWFSIQDQSSLKITDFSPPSNAVTEF